MEKMEALLKRVRMLLELDHPDFRMLRNGFCGRVTLEKPKAAFPLRFCCFLIHTADSFFLAAS